MWMSMRSSRGAGDFGDVALDHPWSAETLAGFVVEVAAGAGIHCSSQHEAGREAERHGSARDGDGVIFQRLPHDLEYVAREFGELVEEEQAVVREGDFAWARHDAAADEAGVGDGVVRRAEGTLRDKTLRRIEHSGDGVDLGGLESFVEGEGREDRGQTFGEHRLAGAGRTDHEDVVTACGGDFEGALGGLLSTDIFEVDGEVLEFAEDRFGRDATGFALHCAEHLRVEQLEQVKERGDGVDVDAFDDGGLGSIGCGQDQIGNVFSRARMATGRIPGTGRTLPSRPSSPTMRKRETSLTCRAP